jgi:hypothetical protein
MEKRQAELARSYLSLKKVGWRPLRKRGTVKRSSVQKTSQLSTKSRTCSFAKQAVTTISKNTYFSCVSRITVIMNSETNLTGSNKFPVKLYNILQEAEKSPYLADIVSWMPDGKSFKVRCGRVYSSFCPVCIRFVLSSIGTTCLPIDCE